MSTSAEAGNWRVSGLFSVLAPLSLFWIVVFLGIPYSITLHFNTYSIGLFLFLLLLYYWAFRQRDRVGVFAALGLTMLLFGLALSYKWTSGFSDNFLIGGLLPYKDAKNYYLGANLIFQGLPLDHAGQATERPLFSGLLSSLLLLTGRNLKIALAILVQLAGIGLYLSARQISRSMGAWPVSLYITCMYFYIQPLTGYTLTEVPGFMLGCFAFILLWQVANQPRWLDLTLGLITLVVALSMRAGAFLILPLLALWVGWIFRGEKRFSARAAACAFMIIFAGYVLVNSIYPRLLGIPPGSAFKNFSYALYGQVRGGTGWHSAIEELGTRAPSAVYRAAWEFFLEHPASLFIGFAKSYPDFFLLGGRSIFPLGGYSWQNWPSILLWMGILLLLFWGLTAITRDLRSNLASLLLTGFTGVLLSIPFLPPIDGGPRFYASTMPFFFIIPAMGLGQLKRHLAPNFTSRNELSFVPIAARYVSVVLLFLTLVVSTATHTLAHKPAYTIAACPPEQKPFVIQTNQGSYIDLVKRETGASVPELCLSDFEKNNTEKSVDGFYQHILSYTERKQGTVRIIPALDLVEEKIQYFYVSEDQFFDTSSFGLLQGCATRVETNDQSLYQVEIVLPALK
jgi:hypothetical protein